MFSCFVYPPSYAIVEFSNFLEANAVVKNNKEYPARIGDSYLNLHVIGHEEVRGQYTVVDQVEYQPINRIQAEQLLYICNMYMYLWLMKFYFIPKFYLFELLGSHGNEWSWVSASPGMS